MVKLAASKRYQLEEVKETSSSCDDDKVDKQELIARRAQHEPSNVDLDYKPWREDGDFSDNSYDESELMESPSQKVWPALNQSGFQPNEKTVLRHDLK